jgi:hypothetical protein
MLGVNVTNNDTKATFTQEKHRNDEAFNHISTSNADIMALNSIQISLQRLQFLSQNKKGLSTSNIYARITMLI